MKGILYSIIAALLIIPIMGLILFNSQLTEKNIDINIRANELEYFSISVKDDLSRFLIITGKRALISAVSKVITEGFPLADAQANLTEMIINGTLDGVIAPLIDTNNLNLWKENVTDIARSSGFDMDIQNIKINITQNDSYNVLFEASIFLNISDPNVKMGVGKNLTVRAAVSIENIEDPLFPLQTFSAVKRDIHISNFSNFAVDLVQGSIAGFGSVSGNATLNTLSPSNQKIFITTDMEAYDITILNQFGGIVSESTNVPSGLTKPYIAGATGALTSIEENQRIYLDLTTKKVWDLQNLTLFVKNKYYKESIDGPSFLDRLEGRTSLSEKYKYGLETFIHQDDLQTLERQELFQLINEQSTRIDYLYWNDTIGSSVRNGGYDTIFDWLKIDHPNHTTIYGVDELSS
jgi:phosphohistidine swiveling domain-containing protein